MRDKIVQAIVYSTILFGVFMGGLLNFYASSVTVMGRTLTETEKDYGVINDTAEVNKYIDNTAAEIDTFKWDTTNIVAYTLEMITSGALQKNILTAGTNLQSILMQSLRLAGLDEEAYRVIASAITATILAIGIFAFIYIIQKVKP